jgi:hypothetical protein
LRGPVGDPQDDAGENEVEWIKAVAVRRKGISFEIIARVRRTMTVRIVRRVVGILSLRFSNVGANSIPPSGLVLAGSANLKTGGQGWLHSGQKWIDADQSNSLGNHPCWRKPADQIDTTIRRTSQ